LTEEENEPEKHRRSDRKGDKENAGGPFSFMNDPNNNP
jgi:hypothetical protein